MTRQWTPWREKPTKEQETLALQTALRAQRLVFWTTTTYARRHQGAPDILIPSLQLAIWVYSKSLRDVHPRVNLEQQVMRRIGWVVLTPETCAEAIRQIEKRRVSPPVPTFKGGL